MLKKTITFEGFDGTSYTEDFYFNLTKAEVVVLEASEKGGYGAALEKIAETKDPKAIISTFQDVIAKAYGEKSADGKRFVKSPELSLAFAQTEAYSVLFMEMVTDADAASKFMNGIIPSIKQDATPAQNGFRPGHELDRPISLTVTEKTQAERDQEELRAFRAAQGATVPLSE